MIVAGVDLSLTATGIVTADVQHCIEAKAIRGTERLVFIREELLPLIPHDADLVVLEALLTVQRAHATAELGMIHGVIRVELFELGIQTVMVPPASLKKYATGKGNATKPDMRVELLKRANLDIRDDNVVDAWWLRAMALDHFGQPVVKVPESHRVALEKVEW